MLKIKDIISMLKDLYKSNLLIENPIDVVLTMGIFSLLCNFLSKIGLIFVIASGILFLFDASKGICLLTLFIPSILIFSNVPVVCVKNVINYTKKHIDVKMKCKKNVEEHKKYNINNCILKDNFKAESKKYNYNEKYTDRINKNIVRIRKK